MSGLILAFSLNNQVHAVPAAKEMPAWWNPAARAPQGGGRRRPPPYPVLLKVYILLALTPAGGPPADDLLCFFSLYAGRSSSIRLLFVLPPGASSCHLYITTPSVPKYLTVCVDPIYVYIRIKMSEFTTYRYIRTKC